MRIHSWCCTVYVEFRGNYYVVPKNRVAASLVIPQALGIYLWGFPLVSRSAWWKRFPPFLFMTWDGMCFISLSRRCSSCHGPGWSIHQSRVMIHFLKPFWVSPYVTFGMIDIMTRLVYRINLNFLSWNGVCCYFPTTGFQIEKGIKFGYWGLQCTYWWHCLSCLCHNERSLF